MTKESLKLKLQEKPELLDQFKFEVLEREAIMQESNVANFKSLALEETVKSWLLRYE